MQTLHGVATLPQKLTGACDDRLTNSCNGSSGRCDLCCQGLDSHKDLRQQNDSSERTKTH
jgi:hypothetical protein